MNAFPKMEGAIVETRPLAAVVEMLVAQHGVLRLLKALVATKLQRKPKVATLSVDRLNDHLLRDIGLRQEDARPKYWELR